MTLVILAAGMGSRYGGLKQLDPVGPNGEILLDYSVFDAVQAGFSEVLFIIRKEIEEVFHASIGSRYQQAFPGVSVRYAFQALDDLPTGFSLPEGRNKPWGTGHALLSARHLINGPFAVINADDYYGPSGYRLLKKYAMTAQPRTYAMVGYHLKNTLSEYGTVSRGICETSRDNKLLSITERTAIKKRAEGIVAQEKDTSSLFLSGEEMVSLNFWGFTSDLFCLLEKEFIKFLSQELTLENQATAEFYLPAALNNLMHQDTEMEKISIQLFPSSDLWFGLTYPEDRPKVQEMLSTRSVV